MTERPVLTPELREGRRALDGVPDVELTGAIAWEPRACRWVLPLRLRADVPADSAIPEWTRWYAHLESTYPFGNIDVLPSKVEGLDKTYPHQRLNEDGSDGLPWRDGRLCLQTWLASLGERGREEEPVTPGGRLAWHVQRAREWLAAAARGTLLAPGEPFELPDLPRKGSSQLAFREDAETLTQWSRMTDSSGWAELIPLPGNEQVQVIHSFRASDERRLLTLKWGDLLRDAPRRRRTRAAWIRLSTLPVLPPHAPPTTWPELRDAAKQANFDLVAWLKAIAPALRDGMEHLCLIGFPISAVVGQPPARLHWWALRLPVLAHGDRAARGARRDEGGYWRRDKARLFDGGLPLAWLPTTNWAPEELRSRGALPAGLRNQRIAVIGAGALGSMVAELLVRGGAPRLVLVDHQRCEAGNLVRHTLGLEDVRRFKTEALAHRLRACGPEVEIHAFNASVQTLKTNGRQMLMESQLVIDCTGDDAVIDWLGTLRTDAPRTFFSASFGAGARRLLCFSARGTCFPAAGFRRMLAGWLEREREELRHTPLPREGIGCWHPIFPARADDVWLAASLALKSLEQATGTAPVMRLDVFEREEDQDGFQGVRRVARTEEGA